ncbi:MAG TPA: TadE family protein [Pyrinomonadaceae bacterium]
MGKRVLVKSVVRRFGRREDGTQMIEFAIVLPILLLLFAGATEIGRMFHTYTTLAKATRAGARYLTTVQSVSASTNAAKNVVMCGSAAGCGGQDQPELILSDLTADQIEITPPVNGAAVKYVTVSITGYTYQPLVFDLNTMTGSSGVFNPDLSPSTTMRYK